MWSLMRDLFYPRNPVFFIVGPTASGKTSCSIALAQALEAKGQVAEVISADSRQIYRDISIFSAAVSPFETQGVTHHLVGTEPLEEQKNAAWFASRAREIIGKLHRENSIPLVVGGSAFWVEGLLYNDDYPRVPPNESLRRELAVCSVEELQDRLKQLDPYRWKHIDIHNPRRLVRSIEIATALGAVPPYSHQLNRAYQPVIIYLNYPPTMGQERIRRGVEQRFEQGLVEEAEGIRGRLSQNRFRELGLAYKYIHSYWEGSLSLDEFIEATVREEVRYAKRQRTFFTKLTGQFPRLVREVTHPEEIPHLIETIVQEW